jgi:cell shape-determining protein MreC
MEWVKNYVIGRLNDNWSTEFLIAVGDVDGVEAGYITCRRSGNFFRAGN